MTEPVKKNTPSQSNSREKLTASTILDEALHIVDNEGLDALSFRSLGKKLGVSQAAFYRHIPDKAALLNGITDLIWHEIFTILDAKIAYLVKDGTKLSWNDIAAAYAYSLYEGLHNHPHAVILMLTHPMNTTNQFAWAAHTLSQIVSLGIQLPPNTLSMINVLSTYVGGFVAAEIVPPIGHEKGEAEVSEPDIKDLLAVLDPKAQEALLQVVAPAVEKDWLFSCQFECGLRAILDGWRY